MDIKAMRQSFIQKVSWGPTRITFADAIKAFDDAALAAGFGETIAPASYSPCPDALPIPVSAESLEAQVLSQAKAKGRSKKEPDVMGLDDVQENEEVLKKLGVK